MSDNVNAPLAGVARRAALQQFDVRMFDITDADIADSRRDGSGTAASVRGTMATRNGREARMRAHNGIDGFTFTAGCSSSVRFDLKGEGAQWPPGRIFLSARGRASSNPLTIERVG